MKPGNIQGCKETAHLSKLPAQSSTGDFKGRSVKVRPGKRFFSWCLSMMKRYLPGFSLLERSVRVLFLKNHPPGQGKYWEEVSLPKNAKLLGDIATDSALTQLPYTLNLDQTDAWNTVRDAAAFRKRSGPTDKQVDDKSMPESPIPHVVSSLFTALRNQQADNEGMKQNNDPLVKDPLAGFRHKLFEKITLLPSGMLCDENSGFTALLVAERETGQLKLIFGGTLSGAGASSLMDIAGRQRFKRPGRSKAQIKANLLNLTGAGIPKCYKQAAKLAEFVKAIVDSDKLMAQFGLDTTKMTLSLAGHSLGGGMVQYAAAKTNLPGRAFSSSALGRAILKDLTKAQKQAARDGLVENYLVDNDLANTVPGYRIWHKWFKPTVIGKRTIIEGSDRTGKNTFYGRHSWSHLHYMEALEHQKNMLAEPSPSYEETSNPLQPKRPPADTG